MTNTKAEIKNTKIINAAVESKDNKVELNLHKTKHDTLHNNNIDPVNDPIVLESDDNEISFSNNESRISELVANTVVSDNTSLAIKQEILTRSPPRPFNIGPGNMKIALKEKWVKVGKNNKPATPTPLFRWADEMDADTPEEDRDVRMNKRGIDNSTETTYKTIKMATPPKK